MPLPRTIATPISRHSNSKRLLGRARRSKIGRNSCRKGKSSSHASTSGADVDLFQQTVAVCGCMFYVLVLYRPCSGFMCTIHRAPRANHITPVKHRDKRSSAYFSRPPDRIAIRSIPAPSLLRTPTPRNRFGLSYDAWQSHRSETPDRQLSHRRSQANWHIAEGVPAGEPTPFGLHVIRPAFHDDGCVLEARMNRSLIFDCLLCTVCVKRESL